MPVTRYTSGAVSVALDSGLEAFVRDLLSAGETETVRILEAAADAEAARAEAAWYGADGVTRRTGKSGKIDRVTTLDSARSEVRVSVGSTDTRQDSKGKGVVPYYVRRPGPLSLVDRYVTQGEWWAWKKGSKPVGKAGTTGKADWVIREPNPKASDGKYLVVELIRKPMTARLREITPELGRAIAARATKRR
jgi:hypothetical protein